MKLSQINEDEEDYHDRDNDEDDDDKLIKCQNVKEEDAKHYSDGDGSGSMEVEN